MANVKITELTELAAVDLADGDVFPIVDVGADTTKKVTVASIRTIADANDFVTYTQLNANIDVVSGNVDAVEANVASIVDTGGHTVTFSGNVIPSADGVYDLGSASAKWKDLHLTGSSIKLGGITISSLGNEGITITGTSGEQANVVTPQLGGAANVSANIAALEANVPSIDTRLGANITLLTNEDTALQARIAANTLVAASNDFITFTRLQANIDLVQDNVATVSVGTASDTETRLNANLDIVQDNVAAISVTLGIRGDGGTNDDVTVGTEELVFLGDTGITTTVSSNTVTIDLDDTAVSPGLYGGVSGGVTNVAAVTIDATGRITNAANISVVTNLDTLQDNINVLDGNADAIATDVTALEARRAANVILSDAEDTAIQSRLTTNVTLFLNEDTALQSRLATNVTAFTNEDTALQARIAANTLVAAANDFVTFTRLNANVDVVQDNVAAEAAAIQSRLTTNVAITTAVETRRVANVTIMNDEDTALQARIAANTLVAAANDFVTFTRLQANIDLVQDNVTTASGGADGVEARRVANIAGAVSTITTGNLTASRALASDGSGKVAVATTTLAELNRVSGVTGDIQTQLNAIEARRAANNIATTFTDDVIVAGNLTVTGETVALNSTNKEINDTIVMLANGTTGTPSQDIGFLFNRGTQGNAAFFYDESATTFKLSDTLDPSSNTSLSPVTASNLSVGIIDAATVKFDGTSVQDAISANVTTLTNADTALQSRLTTNVTAFTNEDTALQARITANATITTAVEARRVANVTIMNDEDTALQARIAANATITTAVEARRVANIAGAVSTITTGNLTASRALASDGSGKVAVSAVTATELGYLASVSSAIQTQLDAKSTTANAAQLATGIAAAGGGSMSDFSLEDGDGTSVEMGDNQRVKFIEGGGVDINFTDVSPGSVADPYDLTFTVASSVIAGAGLTGGGVLSADRTLTVGAGTGITVNADDIAIGQDVATTASPTFLGATVTSNITIGTNASNTVTIVGILDCGALS